MKHLLSLMALILLVSSLAAKADTRETEYSFRGKYYDIAYSLREDKQIIYLEGHILSDIVEDLKGFKRVRKLLRKNVNVELVLESGGGFQALFNKLTKSIKKACNSEKSDCRITTVVPDGSYCASACIPTFMVGDIRRAGQYSGFGFHQAAVAPGFLKIPRMAEGDLRKKGVNSEWLQANKQLFQSLEITWVRPPEMDGSNIVTEISNGL